MTIHSRRDLSELHSLGAVAAGIRDRVAAEAVPGVTTRNLDDRAAALARRAGARSAPQAEYGFPGFLCLSVNDAVVHGIPNDRPLAEGDVLKVDVTLGRGGYVVDTATTVVVGSRRDDAGQRLADGARAALVAALARIRAGASLRTVGRSIEGTVRRRGFTVLRALCGHGVGRRIHEWPSVPNFDDGRDTTRVWDGLVLAVEPIIAERADRVVEDRDGWTLRTHNGCLAAHAEHTIVVREGPPEILTRG